MHEIFSMLDFSRVYRQFVLLRDYLAERMKSNLRHISPRHEHYEKKAYNLVAMVLYLKNIWVEDFWLISPSNHETDWSTGCPSFPPQLPPPQSHFIRKILAQTSANGSGQTTSDSSFSYTKDEPWASDRTSSDGSMW